MHYGKKKMDIEKAEQNFISKHSCKLPAKASVIFFQDLVEIFLYIKRRLRNFLKIEHTGLFVSRTILSLLDIIPNSNWRNFLK